MSMYMASIASGSSGNCIYVGSDTTHLIIDAGISGKKIELGLNLIGLTTKDLHGILVTHEHSDHVKGLGVVARKYKIPIYTSKDTASAILNSKSVGKIPDGLMQIIDCDKDFFINDIKIHPFKTPHDATDPMCYTLKKGDKKISIATDLGEYNTYIINKLRDSNILFIEANHDINMLQVGSYPYYLKQRILSSKGHLSNDLSAKLICELIHDKLQYVVLGHLSKENNFDELAYETVKSEIINLFGDNSNQFKLLVAKREHNSQVIAI